MSASQRAKGAGVSDREQQAVVAGAGGDNGDDGTVMVEIARWTGAFLMAAVILLTLLAAAAIGALFVAMFAHKLLEMVPYLDAVLWGAA